MQGELGASYVHTLLCYANSTTASRMTRLLKTWKCFLCMTSGLLQGRPCLHFTQSTVWFQCGMKNVVIKSVNGIAKCSITYLLHTYCMRRLAHIHIHTHICTLIAMDNPEQAHSLYTNTCLQKAIQQHNKLCCTVLS